VFISTTGEIFGLSSVYDFISSETNYLKINYSNQKSANWRWIPLDWTFRL